MSFTATAQQTHIYAVAHPDDWQLFMNPNVYQSLQNDSTKVVILHTTAGDAGAGKGSQDYYIAREEGSNRAVRFMVNAANPDMREGTEMSASLVAINGHYVMRNRYGNVSVYYLRVPDGNYDGSGYAIHKEHSLRKFYSAEVSSLTTVDGNSTYNSVDDLRETIAAMIKAEAGQDGSIQMNLAETDQTINPEDHSDHLNTSYILQDVAKSLGLKSVRLYQEYATNKKPYNVDGDYFLICAGTWGATASGLSDSKHYSTWDKIHNSWIGRQYFRVVRLEDIVRD
ncbi:MAG: PIG-L family deacetylase [Cyclobacteriaceae bacterium]